MNSVSEPRGHLVVDAANVVGSRPDGWWRDRAGAARRLHLALAQALAAGHLDRPVVLVLEGAARGGVSADDSGGLRVVHAAGAGDDELIEHVRPGATVVTADRELRRRVVAAGGDFRPPSWLWERLQSR